MQKLGLLSVILLTYVLPIMAAKVAQPRRSLATLLVLVVLGHAWYAFFLLVLYPHLL